MMATPDPTPVADPSVLVHQPTSVANSWVYQTVWDFFGVVLVCHFLSIKERALELIYVAKPFAVLYHSATNSNISNPTLYTFGLNAVLIECSEVVLQSLGGCETKT